MIMCDEWGPTGRERTFMFVGSISFVFCQCSLIGYDIVAFYFCMHAGDCILRQIVASLSYLGVRIWGYGTCLRGFYMRDFREFYCTPFPRDLPAVCN